LLLHLGVLAQVRGSVEVNLGDQGRSGIVYRSFLLFGDLPSDISKGAFFVNGAFFPLFDNLTEIELIELGFDLFFRLLAVEEVLVWRLV